MTGFGYYIKFDQALTRIAELEAEVSRLTRQIEAGRAANELWLKMHIGVENELEAEQDRQRAWEGAAHEYEEQARFAQALALKAEAERDRLRDSLRWYGNASENQLCLDHGTLARAALSDPSEDSTEPR